MATDELTLLPAQALIELVPSIMRIGIIGQYLVGFNVYGFD